MALVVEDDASSTPRTQGLAVKENTQHRMSRYALWTACASNDVVVLRALLEGSRYSEAELSADDITAKNSRALRLAVLCKSEDVVRYLNSYLAPREK